jgi:hypothetical protein
MGPRLNRFYRLIHDWPLEAIAMSPQGLLGPAAAVHPKMALFAAWCSSPTVWEG